MKKGIMFVSVAACCFMLAACSNNSAGTNGGKKAAHPEISISNEKGDIIMKNADVDTDFSGESKKISKIDNDILNLLGKQRKIITDEIEKAEISSKKTDDGIQVTTENDEQRKLVINTLDSYIAKYIYDFRHKENCVLNYDIENGYIEAYCSAEDADELSKIVNQISGIIAFGQVIKNNSATWGITVTVCDYETNKTITKGLVAKDSNFSVSADDWKK